MSAARLRREIVATIAKLAARGLYFGTSGNISARLKNGFLITPTGIPSEEIRAAGIVEMDIRGKHKGRLLPSSEWHFHRDIFTARADVNAIVHTHSTFATAISCLRRDIPPFHYMVAKAGGESIRCARYATFGTKELARNALAALKGRRACLLANHGLIALGADLGAARRLAEEVEALCEQYWAVLAVGRPVLLPRPEMSRVVTKFRTYGRQPKPRRGKY